MGVKWFEGDLQRARFVKDNLKEIVFDLREFPLEGDLTKIPNPLQVKSLENWVTAFLTKEGKKILDNKVYNTVFEYNEFYVPRLNWKLSIYSEKYAQYRAQKYSKHKSLLVSPKIVLSKREKIYFKFLDVITYYLPAMRRALMVHFSAQEMPLLVTPEGYKVDEYYIKQHSKFFNFLAKEKLILGCLAPPLVMELVMKEKDKPRAMIASYTVLNAPRLFKKMGLEDIKNGYSHNTTKLFNELFGFDYLTNEGEIGNVDLSYIDSAIENYKTYKPKK